MLEYIGKSGVMLMEAFAKSLSGACKKAQGVTGVIFKDGVVPKFSIVCSDRRKDAIAADRLSIAAAAGRLFACHAEGDFSLSCLYGAPPHLVEICILGASQFDGLHPGEKVLWEWNFALSGALHCVPGTDIAVLLQSAENNFWLLQYKSARHASAGELLEAVDTCSKIRTLCLAPLLQAAGLQDIELFGTVCTCDLRSIYNALVFAGEKFFSLRYELAGDKFVRHEDAEMLAGSALYALGSILVPDRF